MSVAIGSKFLLVRESKTRADIEDWTVAWGYIGFMVKILSLTHEEKGFRQSGGGGGREIL